MSAKRILTESGYFAVMGHFAALLEAEASIFCLLLLVAANVYYFRLLSYDKITKN